MALPSTFSIVPGSGDSCSTTRVFYRPHTLISETASLILRKARSNVPCVSNPIEGVQSRWGQATRLQAVIHGQVHTGGPKATGACTTGQLLDERGWAALLS